MNQSATPTSSTLSEVWLLMRRTPLQLSEERAAFLAPKLEALLADFSQLAALERPDLEPVTTAWLVRSFGRGRR